jgi:hypothetical protein
MCTHARPYGRAGRCGFGGQGVTLVQLDWFFTSVNWLHSYPNTEVLPLAKITSDHIPCKVSIGTRIPKSHIFIFENFWPNHLGFVEAVQEGWSMQVKNNKNSAIVTAAKLKNVRAALKSWSWNLSNLSLLIANCSTVILFLDCLEEYRTLSIQYMFLTVKKQLSSYLRYKNMYWKKDTLLIESNLVMSALSFFMPWQLPLSEGTPSLN